jgi:uncharacterized membrane protein (UPF0127 family)
MKRSPAPFLLLVAGCAMAAPHIASASLELHGHRLSVELATDDASRERGLMFRTELASDHGMLFVFPYTSQQAFWMKNTLVPLDMLFFDADRKLVSMQLGVPPCRAEPCPSYPSTVPARYVLELAAGSARRIGAEIGDELKVNGEIGTVR